MIHSPVAALALHSSYGIGWVMLGSLALVALAVWSYRWTRPPLPVWARCLLAAGRAFALVAVWLLASGFEVRWENVVPVGTRVSILVDRSASMALSDDRRNRDTVVREMLADRLWNDLDRRIVLERLPFDMDLGEQFAGTALPPPDGEASDAHAGLSGMAQRIEGAPDAVVLVSDGAFNRGGSPERAARELAAPIFVIAIGDSTLPGDVVIADVIPPGTVYVGDEIVLDVTVRGGGVDGAATGLRLLNARREPLAVRWISFAGDFAEETIRFRVKSARAGLLEWFIEADPVDGEINRRNNSRRVAVRALERRKRVLLMAGTPSPDAAALARTLEDDPDADSRIIIGAGNVDRPVRGTWPERDDYGKFDVALLVLEAPFGEKALVALREVFESDLPLFVVTGQRPQPEAQQWLQRRMGAIRNIRLSDEVTLIPVRDHPVFTLEREWFEDGSAPPPVQPAGWVPETGIVLAVSGADERGSLVVASTDTRIRTLAVFAGGLWRWDLARRPEDPSGSGYRGIISRILRWLTTDRDAEAIAFTPASDLFAGGEEVELVARVHDEAMRPLDAAEVFAEVSHGGESRTLKLESTGDGRYVGRMAPWGEGSYRAQAHIRTGAGEFSRRADFIVDAFRLEEAELRMRPNRLRAIANASGGALLFPGQIDSLRHLLPVREGTEVIRGSWRPFGRWITLILVVAVLAAEWFVRTRTGMM